MRRGFFAFQPSSSKLKMNCHTETLLEVASRLSTNIPKAVPMIGAEDREELLQDGLAIAVNLQQSARKAGKKVTAGNLAHYTLLHLRAGRRSTGCRANDVLHPACQLKGSARVQSMDVPVNESEHGEEPLTLHDCLAADADDPATTAARRMDWATVMESLDQTAKAILAALAEGRELTLLVKLLKRSRSTLQSDKGRLGQVIREQLGEDILAAVQSRPAWTSAIDAVRERLACRAERRAG
jgi:hypothetical protein